MLDKLMTLPIPTLIVLAVVLFGPPIYWACLALKGDAQKRDND